MEGSGNEATTTVASAAPDDKVECEDCPGIPSGSSPQHDQLLRTVALGVQGGCILITLLLTVLVFRYRKYKAISGSAWILLELILLGAILLYSMVVVRYFEASADLCLLEPWLRELGFTCCYGTIVLKIYRLLVEFRTRKAHRWVVREKDLLKYWAVMVTCVSVYLASGTVSTLQHSEHSMWHWMAGHGQQSSSSVPSSTVTPPATSSIPGRNQSQQHPLFPAKNPPGSGGPGGMSSSSKGESGGIRVRGDGSGGNSRIWTSNASSILLQKARVLRRDVMQDEAAAAISVNNDTLALVEAENNNSSPLSTPWQNQTVKCYDEAWAREQEETRGGSQHGLLYVRFQISSGTYFTVCRQLWWHYVNMAGEFLFLLSGLYISSSARNAASHHGEKLCLFLAIFVEFCASLAYAVLSRIPWITQHPDHIFLLEFVRSQLATSLVLIVIFGPKMFFICRQVSNKDIKRMENQTSQIEGGVGDLLDRVQIPADSEIFKNPDIANAAAAAAAGVVGASSGGANHGGEMDVLGNVDLSQMDPEVIREELKRVYTQLHVLKMKTLRKDNPHISKRRGGRKPPHRRFSLQRSRVQREKSKSNRTTPRKPDNNAEEPCVDESVCSLDGPTTANASGGAQQQQQQQPQPLEPVITELADIVPVPNSKNLTKF